MLVMIVTISFVLILKIENRISDRISDFCEVEMNKITKNIILEAVNSSLDLDNTDSNLLVIDKNSNGQIQSITLDTKAANKMLSLINKKIIRIFNEIESGKTNIADFKNNLISNTDISIKNNGLIFEIPFGIVTGSSFLSNIGPKIPIKIIFSKTLESEIKTEIENYGINNVLFRANLEIKVAGKVIMPVNSKMIINTSKIPIITKMIQGDIPKYYFDKNAIYN